MDSTKWISSESGVVQLPHFFINFAQLSRISFQKGLTCDATFSNPTLPNNHNLSPPNFSNLSRISDFQSDWLRGSNNLFIQLNFNA